MAQAGCRSRIRNASVFLGLAVGLAALAAAEELTFSAKVDKTSVKIGEPIQLTITLSGDVAGIELPAFEFPNGFSIEARSQSTNFTLRSGAAERSVSLIYVLVPQQGGVFQLGPFYLEHQGTTIPTEPIKVTVEKPALPPTRKPDGARFTL